MMTNGNKGPGARPSKTGAACALLALASALAFGALPASAMAETVTHAAPVEVYKDLPGVKPQGEAEAKYACHTATEVDDHWPPGPSARDSLPYLVTRCQTDAGVTYQGTGSLVSPHWFPGINPTDLNPGKP